LVVANLDRLAAALSRIEAAMAVRAQQEARLLNIEAEAHQVLAAIDTLLEMQG